MKETRTLVQAQFMLDTVKKRAIDADAQKAGKSRRRKSSTVQKFDQGSTEQKGGMGRQESVSLKKLCLLACYLKEQLF